MRPYEQARGSRPIPSLPLVVSDSVALCTKAVAGAAGWLLNEWMDYTFWHRGNWDSVPNRR